MKCSLCTFQRKLQSYLKWESQCLLTVKIKTVFLQCFYILHINLENDYKPFSWNPSSQSHKISESSAFTLNWSSQTLDNTHAPQKWMLRNSNKEGKNNLKKKKAKRGQETMRFVFHFNIHIHIHFVLFL